LRVPVEDWSAVKRGTKTEFRLSGKGGSYPKLLDPAVHPTPVVGYKSRRMNPEHERCLLVLEASWMEPLAAISEESLQREGFEDMAHFRRYWITRTKTRFRALQNVQVFRVHPFTEDDLEVQSVAIFRRLYGEFTSVSTEPGVVSRRGPLPASLR
jgi:hypothetical protein